jgi:hypothetical protein
LALCPELVHVAFTVCCCRYCHSSP